MELRDLLGFLGMLTAMAPGFYIGHRWLWGRSTTVVQRFGVAILSGLCAGAITLLLLNYGHLPWFVALGLAFDGAMGASALMETRLSAGRIS